MSVGEMFTKSVIIPPPQPKKLCFFMLLRMRPPYLHLPCARGDTLPSCISASNNSKYALRYVMQSTFSLARDNFTICYDKTGD